MNSRSSSGPLAAFGLAPRAGLPAQQQLAHLARGDGPMRDGVLLPRLVVRRLDWSDYVDLAVDEIRLSGSNQIQVVRRLRDARGSRDARPARSAAGYPPPTVRARSSRRCLRGRTGPSTAPVRACDPDLAILIAKADAIDPGTLAACRLSNACGDGSRANTQPMVWSGWWDANPRPRAPKSRALPLRQHPEAFGSGHPHLVAG